VSILKKAGIAATAVIALTAVAGIAFLWKRPLAAYAWWSRRALARAGLERTSVPTPMGPQAVWQGGSGKALVLLHGAGDQAGTWSGVAFGLARSYRLIIPDLPGHGDSAPSAGPLSMDTVLAGTREVLNRLVPDQPTILVGNSLGGWIAMLLALEEPRRTSRIIVVNGGGLKGDRADLTLTPANREEARNLVSALRDPGSAFVPDFVLDDLVRQSESGPIARLSADPRSMEKYLLEGRIQQIHVPVDLVWGESDRVLDVGYARRMAEQIPAVRLTLIPHCGHAPQQECPQRFAAALMKILQQDPPEAVR
jgi:pimeloyl-ACP methyl ester carboxylesterase